MAGRVRMIRFTSLALKAVIAFAMARYVFPVPAGPTPKTIIFSSMAFTYFCCPMVFGFTGFPMTVWQMISLSSFVMDSTDTPSSMDRERA